METNFELKNGADVKRVSAGIIHASLFTGIGGFDLAAQWMNWENAFQCEIDEWCCKLLQQNFPNAIKYADIKQTDFTFWRGRIDILSGGFPCQPYSVAGKRLGKEDDRHLWPQMLRAVREIQPPWVVGENVRGITNWNGGLVFDEVQADLEAEGYQVLPFLLPACAINAPHRRDRIWFIAYSENAGFTRWNWQQGNDGGFSKEGAIYTRSGGSDDGDETFANSKSNKNKRGRQGGLYAQLTGIADKGIIANPDISGFKERWAEQRAQRQSSSMFPFPSESPVCGTDDGVSGWVDRLKGLGNAIVPQVAYEIFLAIDFCIKEGAFFNSKFVFDKAV